MKASAKKIQSTKAVSVDLLASISNLIKGYRQNKNGVLPHMSGLQERYSLSKIVNPSFLNQDLSYLFYSSIKMFLNI